MHNHSNIIVLSLILGIIKALELGKFLRIILLKILFKRTSIKDVENFEKSTKRNYYNWGKKDNIENV